MSASPTGSGQEAASPPLTFKEAAAPARDASRNDTRTATQLDGSRRTPQDDTAAAMVVPRSWQRPGPMVLANDSEAPSHLAENPDLLGGGWAGTKVPWHQPDLAVHPAQGLDRGLAINHGQDDLAVLGVRLFALPAPSRR